MEARKASRGEEKSESPTSSVRVGRTVLCELGGSASCW